MKTCKGIKLTGKINIKIKKRKEPNLLLQKSTKINKRDRKE
jgi:hypothetical protein